MTAIDGRTPVLIGAGQVTSQWAGEDAASAPSPQDLRRDAAALALADSGRAEAVREAIDLIVAVRTTPDSIPNAPHPFGRCANPPATVAADLGITGARGIYSQLGGDQPQALVNELAAAVHAGEARTVLLVGAEATRALKFAVRKGMTLDWSRSAEGDMEDRGFGGRLLSEYEIANGLGSPTQTYPAFEHALRARLGNSRSQHMQLMSELWAGFSEVAAANPHSQFPQAHSAEFLATPSPGNYPIADPYLKWHVAQDAVNQAAAVIITTVAEAERLGIERARWVFLHGHAKAKDKMVTKRPDLSRSKPIELVLRQALATSDKTVADLALIDLYSCFPVAVLLATEALGIDGRNTPVTLTGGLPFFGGPGNNYSLHAIATMVETLRGQPGAFGLILANGGFLTKEAAGVYSTEPPANWQPQSSAEIQAAIDAQESPALLAEDCDARIETYTVVYKSGEPVRGYVIAANARGRVLARTGKDDAATLADLAAHDAVGRLVRVEVRDGTNIIAGLGAAQ
jgi:acetyl-CoA C-acetyltransferase